MKKTKICGVYKIEHIVSGRCYVGLSVDIAARWRMHTFDAKKSDGYLYRAIRKYGIANFVFAVLEECPRDLLSEREKFWIKELAAFGSGFNLNEGGTAPLQSAETRKKTSDALKGRKKTAEHNAKVSAANKGQKVTEAQRVLFAIAAKARWADPEKRAALMSSRSKKRVCSEETKLKLSMAQAAYMSQPGHREQLSETMKRLHKEPQT